MTPRAPFGPLGARPFRSVPALPPRPWSGAGGGPGGAGRLGRAPTCRARDRGRTPAAPEPQPAPPVQSFPAPVGARSPTRRGRAPGAASSLPRRPRAGPGRLPVPRRPLPAGGRAAADAGSRGRPGARAAPGCAGRELGTPPLSLVSVCSARAGEGPDGRSQPPPRVVPPRPRSHSSREDGCARTRSESSLSRLPTSRPVPSRPGVPGPQSLRPRLRLGAFLSFPRCLCLPVSPTASRSHSLRSQRVQLWVTLPSQSPCPLPEY